MDVTVFSLFPCLLRNLFPSVFAKTPHQVQVDLEMSFVSYKDIQNVSLSTYHHPSERDSQPPVERIVSSVWREIGVEVSLPIRRMTYHQAMTEVGRSAQ